MSNDSYGFFTSGAKALSFLTPGTTHTGVITEDPYVQQQIDPVTSEPKTWKNGDPMLQLVVPVMTNYRDPEIEDDDGSRRLFIGNQGMRNAVSKAVKAAGAKGLDVGGTITVRYTHEGERTNPALNPPKFYDAHYVPPVGGDSGQFLGTASAAGNSAPQGVSAPAQPPLGPLGGNGAGVPPSVQPAVNAGPVQQVSTQGMPPNMTIDVWQSLSPEARQALASLPVAGQQ